MKRQLNMQRKHSKIPTVEVADDTQIQKDAELAILKVSGVRESRRCTASQSVGDEQRSRRQREWKRNRKLEDDSRSVNRKVAMM